MAANPTTTGRRPVCALLALTAALAAWAASAQDLSRTAPKVPPTAPAVATPAPPRPRRKPMDPNLVILKTLNAVRLVESAKATLTRPTVMGASSDVPFAAGAIPALRSFIGKPLTMGALNRMEDAVLAYYRARHRPFVSVTAPPQDLTGGVVQLVVVEYKAGTVKVTKNRWFSARQIRAQIRQQPGAPIDVATVDADLLWLNQNPFRTVDLVTRPGAAPATTDLDFVVRDRFPFEVYAGYANNGSTTTQLDRWQLGAVWGDAFGTGQQLAYQFTASGDFFAGHSVRPDGSTEPSFVAHAVTATIQLPWRNTLQLFGDYEQDHPNVGPDLAGLGVSWQASLRDQIPLPGRAGFSQKMSLGYDFKTTNNDLDFGGATVSANSTEIDQFPITYEAQLRDSAGVTSITDSLVISPGGLTPRNTDIAFQPGAGGTQSGVPGARASYVYDRLDLERDTALPHALTWVVRFSGQVASGNLLPSEQLNVGGMGTVRGFGEDVAGGAEGVFASTELRSPVTHLLGGAGKAGGRDGLQADAFVDYAYVTNPSAIPGSPTSDSLASAGVGVRYAIGSHFSLRAEAGFPFEATAGIRRHAEFVDFAVTVTP